VLTNKKMNMPSPIKYDREQRARWYLQVDKHKKLKTEIKDYKFKPILFFYCKTLHITNTHPHVHPRGCTWGE